MRYLIAAILMVGLWGGVAQAQQVIVPAPQPVVYQQYYYPYYYYPQYRYVYRPRVFRRPVVYYQYYYNAAPVYYYPAPVFYGY